MTSNVLLSFGQAHRRAAPSLQSSGIARIDFRPVLIIYVRYMCAPRARGLAPSRVFLLYRTENRLPTPPRTAPFWLSAEVLANHSLTMVAAISPRMISGKFSGSA